MVCCGLLGVGGYHKHTPPGIPTQNMGNAWSNYQRNRFIQKCERVVNSYEHIGAEMQLELDQTKYKILEATVVARGLCDDGHRNQAHQCVRRIMQYEAYLTHRGNYKAAVDSRITHIRDLILKMRTAAIDEEIYECLKRNKLDFSHIQDMESHVGDFLQDVKDMIPSHDLFVSESYSHQRDSNLVETTLQQLLNPSSQPAFDISTMHPPPPSPPFQTRLVASGQATHAAQATQATQVAYATQTLRAGRAHRTLPSPHQPSHNHIYPQHVVPLTPKPQFHTQANGRPLSGKEHKNPPPRLQRPPQQILVDMVHS